MTFGIGITEASGISYDLACRYFVGDHGYGVPIPPPAQRDLSGPQSIVDFVVPQAEPVQVSVNPQSRGNKYWCEAVADGPDNPVMPANLVGVAATPSRLGYRCVDAGGRVFETGDATDLGSMVGSGLAAPIVDLEASAPGDGYWLSGTDGGVFANDLPGAVAIESTDDPFGYWILHEGFARAR
jgi:hypothetical protein